MYTKRYAIYGALFGATFPIVGTSLEALTRFPELPFGAAMARAQTSAVLWIVDLAPLVLAVMASLAGRRQDAIIALEAARRERFDKTASELFTAAQALLSTVSSFSSMTAETAASVRETTATMGSLGQTATKAALTAETVIGLARQGERTSVEGLSAVESSLGEMMKLADEVRGLSGRIEALNGRMRDIFEIASVVNYIADRSQKLADRAASESQRAGEGAGGFSGVVAEMRSHSEEAKRAAVQVKGILADVHK